MTRMIERWFPCAEVSENSDSGWGSGNIERSLFTWFAARPTAQAKAAVMCSLLPWPEDEAEQKRLQDLVKRAMTGRYAAEDELRSEILNANPAGSNVLDPFCGRGIIPLEASRLGLRSYGIDYSLVAVLASALLTDFPFRDWAAEPRLPFSPGVLNLLETEPRLVMDVAHTLAEVGRRFAESMQAYYPKFSGRWPWGYVWAVTLPCQECGNRYPLVGSYTLRMPLSKPAKNHDGPVQDAGQSFYVDADAATGTFEVVVHDGPPRKSPTLANALAVDGSKILGKAAICPFCGHVHQKATHQRLAAEGYA
jgi:putative DNA methylase